MLHGTKLWFPDHQRQSDIKYLYPTIWVRHFIKAAADGVPILHEVAAAAAAAAARAITVKDRLNSRFYNYIGFLPFRIRLHLFMGYTDALDFFWWHYTSSPFISSPVILSRSFRPLIHFVPGNFVPGHFVPWSFCPLELNLQNFMPGEKDLFKM
jgi:hypothetical protein